MNRYASFLGEFDSLRILEFGYTGSPLKDYSSRAKTFVYHGVKGPSNTDYEKFTKGILKQQHHKDKTVLGLKWPIQHTRWPFPKGKYDEFHAHMLDTYSLTNKPEKGRKKTDPAHPSDIVKEIDRILKPGGTAFLTNQAGCIFWPGLYQSWFVDTDKYRSNFPKEIATLKEAIEDVGFTIELFEWKKKFVDRYSEVMSEAGFDILDIEYVDHNAASVLTREYRSIDNLIIAKKRE